MKPATIKTDHNWTGLGPQLQEQVLSDGSKAYNVVISEETIFCVDMRHAMQLIYDLNKAAKKAV